MRRELTAKGLEDGGSQIVQEKGGGCEMNALYKVYINIYIYYIYIYNIINC